MGRGAPEVSFLPEFGIQSDLRHKEYTMKWIWVICAMSILFGGCGYNEVIERDEDVKAAWAEVENQYKRRADLVPNLVKTVQGAADFDKETLQAVIEARSKVSQMKVDSSVIDNPDSLKAFESAQSGLGSALSKLMVVVEKYPNLKATQSFRDLQAQLEGTENRIAVARKDSLNPWRLTTRWCCCFPRVSVLPGGKKSVPHLKGTRRMKLSRLWSFRHGVV